MAAEHLTLENLNEPSESAVRKTARRRGYVVLKSRCQESCDNHGLYMLADERNYCVLGARFDATLAEIAEYLRECA